MKKYKYTVNGKVSYMNVSDDRLEEFLKLYPDATVVGNEVDFQIDPADAETSAGSETNTVSNLDNGSSVSAPTIDQYLVTIDDLRMSEEAAKIALNKKLSRLGIQAEESLIGDALTFSNEAERQEEFSSVNPVMDYLENSIGDLFRAVRIGEDKSDEELQVAANTINNYIKEKGDINFVNKAKERNKKTYEEDYIPYITPNELDDESITSQMTNEKLEKFERIQ